MEEDGARVPTARGLLWFREKQGREKDAPGTRGTTFLAPLGRKGRPKGAFLKIMKIGNGTKIQLFRKVRRWDPLKTVPRSGFEKT